MAKKSKPTILLVDDDAELVRKAETELEKKFNVVCLFSPYEAIAFLKNAEKKPDVIMTDCFMPAEKKGMADKEKWDGEEIPAGLIVALLALKLDVQKIIICSDMCHHEHPIAWLMDSILGAGRICCGYECEEIMLDPKKGPDYFKSYTKTLEKFS